MDTVNNFKTARSHDQIPPQIDGFTRVVVAGLDINQAKAKAKQLRSPASWFYKGKLYAFVALKKGER
jgi:hypothetical protein